MTNTFMDYDSYQYNTLDIIRISNQDAIKYNAVITYCNTETNHSLSIRTGIQENSIHECFEKVVELIKLGYFDKVHFADNVQILDEDGHILDELRVTDLYAFLNLNKETQTIH